jgi:hypothetical protein
VAAALLPLWGQVDPLWASSGRFDTAALVAAGDYGALTKVWSDAPRLFACAPGGGLVAFSEVGFLGEERPDLRLVDLRGLTDRQIARESSVHTKAIPGVSDTGWFEPGSAVGGVLQDRRPVMIASFDGSPPPVLWGGEYRRVGVRQYVDRRRPHPLTVSVYRRSGDRCGSVERAFARVGAVGR